MSGRKILEADQMLRTSLIRLGACAMIIAGILRGIASIVPASTPHIMPLYLLIDVFLLFGSIGLYAFQRDEIGLTGTLGFILQVAGALILIARDVTILGSPAYPVGALMFSAGVDLFAVDSWRVKKFPRWILLFLVLSTLLGPIGYFAGSLSALFVVSGILFGIGFAGAGLKMLHR